MKYCVDIDHVCSYNFCEEHSLALDTLEVIGFLEFLSDRAWGSIIMEIKPKSRRRLLALRCINHDIFSVWINVLKGKRV
jgi:hypothetical protein